MSETKNITSVSDSKATSSRSLSEVSEVDTIRISVDLVSAVKRNIGFLRTVSEESHWLYKKPTLFEAIRRYEEVWMPLIAELSDGLIKPPAVIPPLDVEWVWFCHTLNPASYRLYCESRFSKLIGKAAIFDEYNEEYAIMRCRNIWVKQYPNEPFENQVDSDSSEDQFVTNQDLFVEVDRHRLLYENFFSRPYMTETMYLIAARQRYKRFLFMMQKFPEECSSQLVLALDSMLMWITHQVGPARVPALILFHQVLSYPTVYADDLKEMDVDIGKVVRPWETVNGKRVKETKKLWEKTFDEPYEKAGGRLIAPGLDSAQLVKPPVYWEVSDQDVNTKYKSMMPRFLLEVCVFARLNPKMKSMQDDLKNSFLRLQTVRCHGELKLEKHLSEFSYDTWRKVWHLYCEFGTRGVKLDLRCKNTGGCFKSSKKQESVTFPWNDLIRARSLALQKEVHQQLRVFASITPPVQAPYLLKCVPDRVTDNSGAMISDVILRMNQYRPQEGRWLSRTVLDHAGRECFIVRIRVGDGFWRRGGETPLAVKWEDRIIEIREGSWSYVAGSIGKAPEKVIATAAPKHPPEHWQASWHFSTGDELMIKWEPSTSISGLSFYLRNEASPHSSVQLLNGRKLQYEVKRNKGEETQDEEYNHKDEGFVTLVRFTEDDPTGRATALLNWKLLVIELLPEEDAVLALLLCVSILRSVSELRKEDAGSLLIRSRVKEPKMGARDWGSVILDTSSRCDDLSAYVQPWYWNAETVMAPDAKADTFARPLAFNHSPADGGDKLYKRAIIT
ncbi:hypothetical protein ACFE04_027955 [Oxalis oulophora]